MTENARDLPQWKVSGGSVSATIRNRAQGTIINYSNTVESAQTSLVRSRQEIYTIVNGEDFSSNFRSPCVSNIGHLRYEYHKNSLIDP